MSDAFLHPRRSQDGDERDGDYVQAFAY
jgi:hypothetical protein